METERTHSLEKQSDHLWQVFRKGDREAFEKIYRLYVKDLLNYGYKILSDKKLIEDSIQDLFFELWQSRNNLGQVNELKFYLFRALRYKMVRNAKTNGKAVINPVDDATMLESDMVSFSHETYLIDTEIESMQIAQLKDLISKLPRRQQEAINLRYYHNFSNEQIAEIMDVNYQSACKFIYTGLKNLKIDFTTRFTEN